MRSVHGAFEVESQLFRPGPHYVLGAFSEPSFVRDPKLREAGQWLGLTDALDGAGLGQAARESATDQWLALLRWCEGELGSDVQVRELRALTQALDARARAADAAGTSVSIDQLWEDTSSMLSASGGDMADDGRLDDADGRGTSAATLRGRRWGDLRTQLSHVLAALLDRASEMNLNLIPREPRRPSTFDGTAHYGAIREALVSGSQGGLAVLAAPPGSGKSELALSYARYMSDYYDHIFWLRADDSFRLQQDYLVMARMLAGRSGTPSDLRREALRVLETSNRWLIIYDAVIDPALLLRYLPLNPEGHGLCTYWPRNPTIDAHWADYLDVELKVTGPAEGKPLLLGSRNGSGALLQPLSASQAATFLQGAAAGGLPQARDRKEIAKLVARSRLAAVLAASWFRLTGAPASTYVNLWEAAGEHGQAVDFRAALILLWELSGERSFRPPVDPEIEELDLAAVELLGRLVPFGEGGLPEVVLDHPTWTPSTRIDDPRLVRLAELGLVDRSDGFPHIRYFEVHRVARAAVRSLGDFKKHGEENLASAARTVLHEMEKLPPGRPLDSDFDLLPHAEELADRELSDQGPEGRRIVCRPLVAIELRVRAAMFHQRLRRVRAAEARLRLMEQAFEGFPDRIRATLRDTDEAWGIESHTDFQFDIPIKRMAALMASLRQAEYPDAALRLYDLLEKELLDDDDDEIDAAGKAQVFYEGALVLRDLDEIDRAEEASSHAMQLWDALDERWWIAARAVVASLEIDRGELASARRLAEETLDARAGLLDRATTQDQIGQGSADVARSYLSLGRIAFHQGRIPEAETLFQAAEKSWTKALTAVPSLPRISRVSARSNLALMRALRGHLPDAEQDALQAWREANAIYVTEHRGKITIVGNAARVLRLAGRTVAASDAHLQALEMCERFWGTNHRYTVEVRREYAESLLDRGQPEAAFVHLCYALDASRGDYRLGKILARARAWTVLGRLLIDNALSAGPIEVPTDATMLDLGRQALEHAITLFGDAGSDPEHRHPELVTCRLGLAEFHIRRRDGRAVEAAQSAYDLVCNEFAQTGLPTVRPLAKLVRARVLAVGNEEGLEELKELERTVKQLSDHESPLYGAYTPADRLEIALAQIDIDRAILASTNGGGAHTTRDLYKTARATIDRALAPLRSQIGDEPHQLVGRGYAELALLAHRLIGPRQRARNERERDRTRPPFNFAERQFDITKMLHEQGVVKREARERLETIASRLGDVTDAERELALADTRAAYGYTHEAEAWRGRILGSSTTSQDDPSLTKA
jgi:tetratricopeptide (TPR) repeat protein